MRWIYAARRFLRPRPLDWNRGAGRPSVDRPVAVDIIIPVYGAAAELRLCLKSVSKETDLTRHGVILVLDGPQDADVAAIVDAFAAAHGHSARVLHNDHRIGFAGSVNRGMTASNRDVVLLNTDTIVTARWLEKLIDAANSCGDIGTVTPLSNHATLCSTPRAFEENLLPSGLDVPSFAAIVESVSRRSYSRLPTGVGFCLYIRRALLEDIGLFDARRFGMGYGEENDFCIRALARGWLHVADDATFVYHSGHRSFGGARMKLERRARRALGRRHRRYNSTIAEFMRLDPLAPVRARIESALAPSRASTAPLRIAHLVHGWPPFQYGGSELYASWLVSRQRHEHDVAVYTRMADPSRQDGEAVELFDEGARVRLVTNNFTARDPLRRNAIRDRWVENDFERFLRAQAPHLLHVQHLAGHAFSLVRVARRLRIPIVLQIHDWWFLCARVNQFDRWGERCAGPTPTKCARCATLTRIPPARITNRMLHAMRRSAADAALAYGDALIAGSNAIRDDYARAVPRKTPIHVIPWGVAIEQRREKRAPTRRPIRFGYVGSIAPHKGVHVAVEAMGGIDAADAEFHVWGDARAFPEYAARIASAPGVVSEGSFAEEDKSRVFDAMDVLLVPSIGLESFGLAAREAMARGVPVVATAGGALSEMFEPGLCGEFVPPGDAVALRAVIRRIIDQPAIVDRWSENLPRPKGDDVHAKEIEVVYRSVLERRSR